MMSVEPNPYETESLLQMYLSLNYPLVHQSSPTQVIPPMMPHHNAPEHALHFPQRMARLLMFLAEGNRTNNRALDIGCAVGGSAFELSKSFEHVEAFDFSESFIQAAMAMQKDRKISFKLPMEGDMYEPVTAILPAESTSTNTINFFVGDACNMPPPDRLGTFDAILCSNLLCRLPDPMALLNVLPDYLNIGGVVLFVSPYSWLEEYTPRDKWIGGCTNENGTAVNSKQRLREIMEARGFALVHDEAVPLVIREHARKYQYIISDATGWRRVK